MKRKNLERNDNRRPTYAVVKIMGPVDLVDEIEDLLSRKLLAVPTSDHRPNSEGEGVHVFWKVLGVREVTDSEKPYLGDG